MALRGAMDSALAELDVTTPQFSVLTMIVAYPGVSGADLARLTFLTPQTINVIVRNLERDGMVEKSAHATHGRILRLHATARRARRCCGAAASGLPKWRRRCRRCWARTRSVRSGAG